MKKESVLVPFAVLVVCGSIGNAQEPALLERLGLGELESNATLLRHLGAAGSVELGALAEIPVPVEEDRARPGGKCMVEMPIRDALAVELVPAADPRAGLVRWHPSLESAELAAATSGRPVLLFQLLGRLDDEFC